MLSTAFFILFGVILTAESIDCWLTILALWATIDVKNENEAITIPQKAWIAWAKWFDRSIVPALGIAVGIFLHSNGL